MLAAPDFSKQFKLEVDASAVGMGAVLLQEEGSGLGKPVSFLISSANTKSHIPPLRRKHLHNTAF